MNHDTNNATTTHALGLSGTMHIRSVSCGEGARCRRLVGAERCMVAPRSRGAIEPSL